MLYVILLLATPVLNAMTLSDNMHIARMSSSNGPLAALSAALQNNKGLIISEQHYQEALKPTDGSYEARARRELNALYALWGTEQGKQATPDDFKHEIYKETDVKYVALELINALRADGLGCPRRNRLEHDFLEHYRNKFLQADRHIEAIRAGMWR